MDLEESRLEELELSCFVRFRCDGWGDERSEEWSEVLEREVRLLFGDLDETFESLTVGEGVGKVERILR